MLADGSGPCLFIRVGTAESPRPPLRAWADMQPSSGSSEKKKKNPNEIYIKDKKWVMQAVPTCVRHGERRGGSGEAAGA